jgi:hypothetical protein
MKQFKKWILPTLLFMVAVFSILCIPAGIVLGMATVAAQAVGETSTTVTTEAASPGLLRNEISKAITKFQPDRYPLDTILREIGNLGGCKAWEYEYWSVDQRGVTDVTAAAYARNNASATGKVTVTNLHIWAVDDNLIFPTVMGYGNVPLRCHVVARHASDNQIEVVALNGFNAGNTAIGTIIPDIAEGKPITRLAAAKNETDAQTTPYANMPTNETNYCQIMMAQVEESVINKLHNKEVDWGILDYKRDAILDMRRTAELQMLYGFKKKIYDPVAQEYKYSMGGALEYITDQIDWSITDGIAKKDFNAWGKEIFTGNNGSDKKIVFAGNSLLEALMNVDLVQKQMESGKTEIVAGMKFKLIETTFGDLLLKRHQAFEDVYGYSYNGLVLDLEHVERRIMEATKTDVLNLDKTGTRRVEANRILETWTMAFKYPECHRWIIGNSNANPVVG